MAQTLPEGALTIRNRLYLEACSAGPGELIDVTDPTLAGRLVHPKVLSVTPVDLGSSVPSGVVVLAYVIELDASVRQITVLQSSGHKELDEAAVKTWSGTKLAGPVTLDGKPVRALSYSKMPFSHK
jgi:TonB family protein